MNYLVTVTRTGHTGRTFPMQSARSAAALAEAFIHTNNPWSPITVEDLLCSARNPRITWMSGTRSLHVTIERGAA